MGLQEKNKGTCSNAFPYSFFAGLLLSVFPHQAGIGCFRFVEDGQEDDLPVNRKIRQISP